MSHTTTSASIQGRPAAITLAVHVLLLMLLLLWKFTLPAEPAPTADFGMEINLGTGETGSGADQPMYVDDPAATERSNAGASAAADMSDPMTSDEADAPSINTRKNQRLPANNPASPASATGRNAANASNRPAAAVQQPRAIYPGSTGAGGNSAREQREGGSEGIAGGAGDQGVPGGTPGATAYSGTPGSGGNGYSHSLSGRTIERAPTDAERFREGGRVVVRVTVNRDGAIVNKVVRSSTNTELNAIAVRRLQGVRFNRSEAAPEEQFGTITFVFKTRK